ncbi:unnamed protein product [Orchesella dallaii]|uniref:Coenzyme PQQ synthesis protein F-like C-terminal lobe domain-containing protein n=1 Tax=Orchesella dallaii TaxID=48710 RepID=A0ABP1S6K3_9HEXA
MDFLIILDPTRCFIQSLFLFLGLTLAEFVDFVKAFKERMLIDLFLAGYVTKAQGERVLNSLKKLKYEPIDVDQQPISRCLRLPRGERVIRVNSQNPSVHTSVVINSYQFGMLTVAEEEVVNFLSQTMSEAAFNQLRTEEQLGYYVDISADVTFEVSSIVIELVTQPKNFTTEYCNECIDNFLLDFFTNNLADEKAFQSFSLAKPKVELPFSLIQRLFASYLLPNPFTYRKLSIQVVGAVPDTPSPLELTNIENIDDTSQKIPQFTPKNQVRRIQSVGAQTTIDKVRAAKKSMQMRGDSFSTDGDKNNRQSERKDIKVKVVTDLAKFKRTLMDNSFDSKRLIQN